MKCFTINEPDKLKPHIRIADVKEIVSPTLRKKKQVTTAFLGFELLPGCTYAMFGSPQGVGEGLYGYGLPTLEPKQTTHGKRLHKDTIMILFDHTRFYPDVEQGDKSRAVWMDHTYVLVVTSPKKFFLRETGTDKIYTLDSKCKLCITVY